MRKHEKYKQINTHKEVDNALDDISKQYGRNPPGLIPYNCVPIIPLDQPLGIFNLLRQMYDSDSEMNKESK